MTTGTGAVKARRYNNSQTQVPVTEIMWVIHQYMVQQGGSADLQEIAKYIQRSVSGTRTILHDMVVKGVIEMISRSKNKAGVYARYRLVAGATIAYFPHMR